MNVLKSSILLSAIILFYFPSIVYHDNADFFETSFPYIALLLLALLVAVVTLLWLPSLFLNTKWKDRYAVILASFAFVGWFHGIFLVFDLGLLDGQGLRQSISRPYQSAELAAALAGLALLTAVGWKWPKIHRLSSLFLLLLTAGLCVITILSDKQNYSFRHAPETMLRASSQKNVFVILFDTFQSDIFDEILKEEPSLQKRFDGFTFFKQTASVAPTTYLAMPAIHSGSIYSLNQSMPNYYDEGIRKKSFLAALASKGYEASLINSVGPCPEGATCSATGDLMGDFWSPIIRDAALLIDISLYRFAPPFFRSRIYNDGKWTVSPFVKVTRTGLDIEFLKQLNHRLSPTTNRPVVRFIHFYITHPPAEVNADCQFVEKQYWTWQTAKTESRCAVRLFTDFLQELKEKDLYDKSLIILMSDHGAGLIQKAEPRIMAKARSLLLIKPFQSRGTLKVSNKPLHVSDVATTVCRFTGECEYTTGSFAFAQEKEKRTVLFLDYRWQHKYWSSKSVPIDAIWQIAGPVDNILSWYKQTPPLDMQNVHLDFSDKDPISLFGFGWNRVVNRGGNNFRWARDPNAQLFLPLKQKKDVRIDLKVFTLPRNRDQSITLYLDDSLIGEQSVFSEWHNLSFNLPGESITKPVTRLTFRFKKRALLKTERNMPVTVAFDSLDAVYQ